MRGKKKKRVFGSDTAMKKKKKINALNSNGSALRIVFVVGPNFKVP
jgi:alkyl hydroperoxide reductase subunit AhpC